MQTLRELLVSVRDGAFVLSPVLVDVNDAAGDLAIGDDPLTAITQQPSRKLDWAEEVARQFADNACLTLHTDTAWRATTEEVKLTIGRSRRCDFRVMEDSVSSVHAEVIFDAAAYEYFLVDLESRNGTFLNGTKLEPGARTALWPGAFIAFGKAMFAFLDPSMLKKLATLV